MQNIASRLNDERVALLAFIGLLESEQAILTGEDTTPLLELANIKSKAASQLTGLIAARRNLMQADGGADMESWLGRRAPELQAVWQEIRQLAERAQQLNSINGELIQVRMRHNQQALTVLHNATSDSAGLYGRDGQPNLASGSRRILGTV
jgi:flagella synthesis protein FlgN